MTTIDGTAVLDLLRPGQCVLLGGGVACPNGLVRLLNENPERTRGVQFIQARAPVIPAADLQEVGEGATLTTIFMAAPLQEKSWVRFVPMQYRRFYDWLETTEIDLALLRGGREPNGAVNLGFSADFAPGVMTSGESGTRIVVEVSDDDPLSRVSPQIPLNQLAGVFVSDEQLPAGSTSPRSEVEERIGRHVAELVRDGDTIQTGIGAIPDAVLDSLSSHRDLGFHSGMLSDGARRLIDDAVITGRRKTHDTERHVTGFFFGEQELYGWAAQRDDVDLRPVSYTHDALTLASLDDLVIVNSAVQVDLFGQVNAEMIRGRQVSGTGGAVDFFRGAALSTGGRSIVALPATAARGKTSRIVARLDGPGVATALRTDCDFVVTEYGVAALASRTVEERAEALLEICAPEFQAEVAEAWTSMRQGPLQ